MRTCSAISIVSNPSNLKFVDFVFREEFRGRKVILSDWRATLFVMIRSHWLDQTQFTKLWNYEEFEFGIPLLSLVFGFM